MADFTPVETRIDRVTVFRNGALVVRTGQAISSQVSVGGLPLLFSAQSLRVRPAQGVVRHLRETCHVEGHKGQVSSTEARRRALGLEAEQIADEARSLDAMAKCFEGLSPSAPPERMPPELPDPTRWLALQSFSAERLGALDEARRDLTRRREALEEALAQLNREDQGDQTPPRFTRGVTFTLEGDISPDQPVDFEVEYFVAAARWVPTYRLELAEGRARLILAALVAQATGEDWRSAALAFSTADLSRETTLPALDSWRIGAAQPNRSKGFRPLPTDLPTLFVDYHEAVDQKPPPSPLISALLVPGERSPAPADEDDGGHTDRTEGATMVMSSLELRRDRDTVPSAMPPPGGPPPAQAAMAPMLDMDDTVVRAPMAKKSRGMVPSFGSGGGGAPVLQEQVYGGGPPDPSSSLPPRLRYAWMRLAGADEPLRGTLQPMNPFEHLWALLEGQSVSDPELLRRAMDALEQRAARLRHAPLPPGTSDLGRFHFQHTYPAQGQHEVPADGAFHRVGVHRQEGDARLECRTVPRESNDVFTFCRLTTPEQIPLPEGPLHVTVDGTFRTAARLRGTGGGAELALSLGLEPDVRVVARRVDTQQSDKGLMSQTTRVDHHVVLTVRSALDTPIEVVVYDRLPVADANTKDLHVELVSSTPTPMCDDRDPRGDALEGGLHWRVSVPAHGATDIAYDYAITLPARTEVQGGNRRE
ncbi:MAG: DUF4139 domain-containing protein [Bradymonadia bacterium]